MNNLTIFSNVLRNIVKSSVRPTVLSYSNKASTSKTEKPADTEIVDDDTDEQQPDVATLFDDGDDKEAREAEIERKRNISRLLPQDRRRLHQQVPYDEPQSWVHKTILYQRKLYGRYGAASGIDPRLLFPTPKEILEQTEYDRVAFPHTISEMMAINERQKAEKREAIRKREDDIAKKLQKLEQLKADLNARIAKKEAEAMAAKEHKARLIEDVRREFGFKLDPRDARFKEMLAEKELQDKKARKLEKRKLKEEKILKRMQEKALEGEKPIQRKPEEKGEPDSSDDEKQKK